MDADPQRMNAQIYAVLDRPGFVELPKGDVDAARIDSGMAVLKAIAANPTNGNFGPLATLVSIGHNQFLPSHIGNPGIPLIVPFAGADAREGVLAEPQEIDSYRANPAGYTGGLDGVVVPHDQKDASNNPSPLACRYSIVQGRFKFTGLTAQLPLVQLTRQMADTGVPDVYEATIVKLSILKLVKPSSEFFGIARAYDLLGREDLVEIQGGKVMVKAVPMPGQIPSQKEVV